MTATHPIIAQPTALEIARERLAIAIDKGNAGAPWVQENQSALAVAAALLALVESTGEIANALGIIADAGRRAERRE